jgi:hypothetical protein
MNDGLKVKFLTVIWGERYIEEFAQVSLPSYLAQGNLPFLAWETDLEILIMTSKESRRIFDEEPLIERLKAICPVRFIFIDDLIASGNYGVILTLAYARGILDSGAEQTNTNFIFMNSDFVLADGSLKTLVRQLQRGERCIMAPSLRAVSATTIPVLLDAVDPKSGVLTMPPREMVKLAFDNLHPTVIGKTITQKFLTCDTHNQIYWQVDESTLLGRYHLIFMLAIKPEVAMETVNSYCDYGFVPELVPSGQFTVIDDSDDFFMLELQAGSQEKEYLRCGVATLGEIADQLSSWTTREHRRFAETDVVFHTGELPSRLAHVREEVAAFMVKLGNAMSAPVTHVDHFYWVSGVRAWVSLKYGVPYANVALPPEKRGRGAGLISRLRRPARERTYVPIWSHLWLDSRLLTSWVASTEGPPPKRNLLICDVTSPLPRLLKTMLSLDVEISKYLVVIKDPVELAANTYPPKPQERPQRKSDDNPVYDNILIHVDRDHLPWTREKLAAAARLVKPGGNISVYIQDRNGEFKRRDLALYICQIFAADWIGYRITARFVGGRTKRRLRRLEMGLTQWLSPSSVFALPRVIVAVVLWPIIAGLTAAHNFRLRNIFDRSYYCSSALVSFTKAPANEAYRTAPADAGVHPVGTQVRGSALGVDL